MHKPLAMLTAGATLLAACATTTTTSEYAALSPSAAEGRAFAEANCATCHAIDDGVSPNRAAPSLRRAAHRMPDWMVEGSFERGVQVGHTGIMPVMTFEDEDIANLVAYFEALREREREAD